MSLIDGSMPVPMVGGALPLLGHAIGLAMKTDPFMAACKRQCGDVFRIRVGGRDIVVLLNPHDVERFYGLSRHFGAYEIHADNSYYGFKLPREPFDKTFDHQIKIIRECLAKNSLDQLTATMQKEMEKMLLDDLAGGEWKEVSLRDWMGGFIFVAGGVCLFGRGQFDLAAYRDFVDFDDNILPLFGRLPEWLVPKGSRARRKLLDVFLNSRDNPDKSEIVALRHAMFAEKGISDEDTSYTDLSLLWAGNSNTISATFWSVLHALSNKECRAAILGEMELAREAASEFTDAGQPVLNKTLMNGMDVTNACLDEVLRLYASTCMMRDAVATTEMDLQDGRVLRFDVGDRVAVYPRFWQVNGDIFDDPLTFRWNRFVGDPDFYYRGVKLQSPVRAFGGGANICPGRFFSLNEFRVALLAVLTLCDMEILDPIPDCKANRRITGVIPPVKDVRARVRLKMKPAAAKVAA